MHVNYINNETRDFLGAQQNHVCCKKLEWLRKQHIAPLQWGAIVWHASQIYMYVRICTYVRYSPTTTSHKRYTSRVLHCGQGNNHVCTYKFTRLQNTCDSYTIRSHACAIYLFSLIGMRVKTTNTVL